MPAKKKSAAKKAPVKKAAAKKPAKEKNRRQEIIIAESATQRCSPRAKNTTDLGDAIGFSQIFFAHEPKPL